MRLLLVERASVGRNLKVPRGRARNLKTLPSRPEESIPWIRFCKYNELRDGTAQRRRVVVRLSPWAPSRRYRRGAPRPAAVPRRFAALPPRVPTTTIPGGSSRSDGRRLPSGGGRKVRTPQGSALGNAQSGQLEGKCHRKQTASPFAER